jgi:large conductance mechanosensitive channel
VTRVSTPVTAWCAVLRGNIVDLAVAVALGAAFNALVTAFGNAFLKPLLGRFLGGGIQG